MPAVREDVNALVLYERVSRDVDKITQCAADNRRAGKPFGEPFGEDLFQVLGDRRSFTLAAAHLGDDGIAGEETLAVMDADQDRRFLAGKDSFGKTHLYLKFLQTDAARKKTDDHRRHEKRQHEK